MIYVTNPCNMASGMAFKRQDQASFYFQLPCHPHETMEDPLSICGDYEALTVPKWLLVTTVLKKRNHNIDSLLEVIDTFQPDIQLDTLRVSLESFLGNAKACTKQTFFSQTVPAMIDLALRMPELFPTHTLPVLREGVECEVSFTSEQTACLLSHMFLCSVQPSRENRFWVNFSVWYKAPVMTPVLSYLHSLLTYFESFFSNNSVPAHPTRTITFSRRVLTQAPSWRSSEAVLTRVVAGCGSEPQEGEAQVVFSNKDIGFGPTGTQEEAVFGMSPEMSVVMLIAPTMRDNEAILVQGPEVIGRYTGVGRGLKFNGSWGEPWDWDKRRLIAIDALEIDAMDPDVRWVVEELREGSLRRELNKCFCGFRSVAGTCTVETVTEPDITNGSVHVTVSEEFIPSIATGHWGCGAFGGHKQAKALIQLMAASQSNARLVFYDIAGNGKDQSQGIFVTRFQEVSKFLIQKRITVGKLYEILLHVGHIIQDRKIQEPDLFHLVMDQV